MPQAAPLAELAEEEPAPPILPADAVEVVANGEDAAPAAATIVGEAGPAPGTEAAETAAAVPASEQPVEAEELRRAAS